jgi:hypothetical protein
MPRQSRAGALVTDYYRPPGTAGSTLRAAPPPPAEPDPGFEVELSLSLKAMAGQLDQDREFRERLAAAIQWIEVPAIGAFTPAQIPYLQGTWGPNDGWAWAIQRLTVASLSTGDSLQVYRGASVSDANGSQNLRQGFQGTAGPVQVWNPGRTGCMIPAQQNLIISGTLTGGPYMLNADVIQIETWAVPYFLL